MKTQVRSSLESSYPSDSSFVFSVFRQHQQSPVELCRYISDCSPTLGSNRFRRSLNCVPLGVPHTSPNYYSRVYKLVTTKYTKNSRINSLVISLLIVIKLFYNILSINLPLYIFLLLTSLSTNPIQGQQEKFQTQHFLIVLMVLSPLFNAQKMFYFAQFISQKPEF